MRKLSFALGLIHLIVIIFLVCIYTALSDNGKWLALFFFIEAIFYFVGLVFYNFSKQY